MGLTGVEAGAEVGADKGKGGYREGTSLGAVPLVRGVALEAGGDSVMSMLSSVSAATLGLMAAAGAEAGGGVVSFFAGAAVVEGGWPKVKGDDTAEPKSGVAAEGAVDSGALGAISVTGAAGAGVVGFPINGIWGSDSLFLNAAPKLPNPDARVSIFGSVNKGTEGWTSGSALNDCPKLNVGTVGGGSVGGSAVDTFSIFGGSSGLMAFPKTNFGGEGDFSSCFGGGTVV